MIQVVLGRKGCGKTTFVKTRIHDLARVLVYDTLGEYSDLASSCYSLESFLDECCAKEKRLFRLALVPIQENLERSFQYFCRSVWAIGDVTAVIDEIDAVSSPVSVPDEFAKLCRYGRHRQISLITASRRASEIPRILTSQTDSIVSFNQSEPIDLQYLAKTPAGADFAESVSRLAQFQYLEWRPWEAEKTP